MFLRKKRPKAKVVAGIALSLLWASCQTDTVYHSYQTVPAGGWKKSDTLCFSFPVTDTLKAYRLTVEIRNENVYPYQDLYLFIHRFNTKDSALSVTDTIRCVLSDREGKWKGTGVGTYQSVHPYAIFPIRYKGDYKIGISHGMKEDCLSGIDDIGLNVEKIR